jgi:hypothetical protein
MSDKCLFVVSYLGEAINRLLQTERGEAINRLLRTVWDDYGTKVVIVCERRLLVEGAGVY